MSRTVKSNVFDHYATKISLSVLCVSINCNKRLYIIFGLEMNIEDFWLSTY